jgi:hypothetical protein
VLLPAGAKPRQKSRRTFSFSKTPASIVSGIASPVTAPSPTGDGGSTPQTPSAQVQSYRWVQGWCFQGISNDLQRRLRHSNAKNSQPCSFQGMRMNSTIFTCHGIYLCAGRSPPASSRLQLLGPRQTSRSRAKSALPSSRHHAGSSSQAYQRQQRRQHRMRP